MQTNTPNKFPNKNTQLVAGGGCGWEVNDCTIISYYCILTNKTKGKTQPDNMYHFARAIGKTLVLSYKLSAIEPLLLLPMWHRGCLRVR